MDPYTGLDTPALWALAFGFFSPPVISTIQQRTWTPRTKALVTFGFCIVTAVIGTYFAGLFTFLDIGRSALLIFLAAAASYQALWKPTGVSPAIEKATSAPEPPA
jgi:hypothetical protein